MLHGGQNLGATRRSISRDRTSGACLFEFKDKEFLQQESKMRKNFAPSSKSSGDAALISKSCLWRLHSMHISFRAKLASKGTCIRSPGVRMDEHHHLVSSKSFHSLPLANKVGTGSNLKLPDEHPSTLHLDLRVITPWPHRLQVYCFFIQLDSLFSTHFFHSIIALLYKEIGNTPIGLSGGHALQHCHNIMLLYQNNRTSWIFRFSMSGILDTFYRYSTFSFILVRCYFSVMKMVEVEYGLLIEQIPYPKDVKAPFCRIRRDLQGHVHVYAKSSLQAHMKHVDELSAKHSPPFPDLAHFCLCCLWEYHWQQKSILGIIKS